MKLMYEGAGVAQWRCELDKEAPEMFSVQGMNRVVARDPVAMAEFFDLTLRLFLRHVVGVCPELQADGVASACGVGGVFGPVLAYFGPVETQGRGGLHPHMHVWILHPFRTSMLAKLRAGEEVPDLANRVEEWNAAVLEHVPTVQFESVEEVGRQVGVPDVAPLPYSNAQRQACWTAAVEGEVEEPRVSAPPGFRTYANWKLCRVRDGSVVDLWAQLREGNAALGHADRFSDDEFVGFLRENIRANDFPRLCSKFAVRWEEPERLHARYLPRSLFREVVLDIMAATGYQGERAEEFILEDGLRASLDPVLMIPVQTKLDFFKGFCYTEKEVSFVGSNVEGEVDLAVDEAPVQNRDSNADGSIRIGITVSHARGTCLRWRYMYSRTAI